MQVGNGNIINNKIASEIKKSPVKSNVNFTSSLELEKKIIQEIAPKGKSKFINFMNALGHKNSEIVNIITTNIGTAFVAPIFIAFNPISKQDKDTKTYSAMRQPISAVLALATQFGINQTFNKFMDKTVSTKDSFKWLDLSMKPQESYIKRTIKKENKKIGKEALEALTESKIAEAMKTAVKEKAEELKKLTPETLLTQHKLKPSDIKTPEMLKKAAKAILDNNIKITEGRLKVVKIVTGIALSLVTLPPTCTLLNWLYPRFMEVVFPNLANAKSGKEGK